MTNKEKAKELLTTVRMMINSQVYGTDIINICNEAKKTIDFAELCYPYDEVEDNKFSKTSVIDIILFNNFKDKGEIQRKDLMGFIGDKTILGDYALLSTRTIENYLNDAKLKGLLINPSHGKYKINKAFKI